GILDHELFTLGALLVIDLRTRQILQAHRVDQQRHAAPFHARVLFADLFVESEAVLKARAAATLDEHPELEGGVAFLVDQLLHLVGGSLGEDQRIRYFLRNGIHLMLPKQSLFKLPPPVRRYSATAGLNCTTLSDLLSS